MSFFVAISFRLEPQQKQLINFQKEVSVREFRKRYLERFTVSLHTFFRDSARSALFFLNKMEIKRNFLKEI